MNYRLSSSNVRRSRKPALYASLALIAALVLLRVLAPGFSTRVMHAVSVPLWRSGNAVADTAELADVLTKSKTALARENANLRRELESSRRELSALQSLASENDELRRLLDLSGEEGFVTAVVLAKPPLSPYDSLVIEFGPNSPVAVGARVYAEGDAALGEIAEVNGTTAIARLYSTAGTEVDGTMDRTNVEHKAQGTGGGSFELKVPKEVDIQVGDKLVMPGLRPKVLGIVRQIDSRPSDSFQHALIKSPVNIFQLEWVMIERK